MLKIAVVTDSNSGITQSEAKEMGISVIPMPFFINDKEYLEDITLTQDQFYEHLQGGADIHTSQPTPDTVMKLWDELLKEYDEIVHIPMSSGLSGSCESATMLAQEYNGKVQVVNNQRISVTQRQSVVDAMELAALGKNAAQIKEILENDKFNSSIYIMLETLYYLKKGGRITPAAAMLGTLLKIKPVLQIQGEKLDAFAKARTAAQGKSIMIKAIQSDFTNRFKADPVAKNMKLFIAHSHNAEAAEVLKQELNELFPGYPVEIGQLSLSVSCHIGLGALAIACTKNLDYSNV